MSGENAVKICLYIGKQCRYGEDAPVEEQMDCSTCPAYILWSETVLKKSPHEFKDSLEDL